MAEKSKGRKAGFSPKQIERMRHLKAEGFSNADISKVFNVHHSTVGAYLRGERGVESTRNVPITLSASSSEGNSNDVMNSST